MSVGNLIVGGAGKTPLVATLAKRYEDAFVVLRGYGRESEATLLVSQNGKIMCDVHESGDEAMLLAKEGANVIVAKRREEGIALAKAKGAKLVILDDAFHKCYEKFDILIDVDVKNGFCLPAGPWREPRSFSRYADMIVKEGRDFTREVRVENPGEKMVFLTAIANAKRVERYLPKGMKKYYFPDHHFFTKKEVEKIWRRDHPDRILVTAKDLVKLEKFSYPFALLALHITIKEEVFEKIDRYIGEYYEKEDKNRSDAA